MPEHISHNPNATHTDTEDQEIQSQIDALYGQFGAIEPAGSAITINSEHTFPPHESDIDNGAQQALKGTPAKFRSENLNPIDSQVDGYKTVSQGKPNQPTVIKLVEKVEQFASEQWEDLTTTGGIYDRPVSLFGTIKNSQQEETARERKKVA